MKHNSDKDYIRSKDFIKNRSEEYLEYVDKIGIKNIEIIWLYKTNDENVRLNKIEKHFQELYFDLYKDKFLCFEMVAYGERNPNFGNYWSQEKKDKLSEKRKNNKHSKGKNNPRATECILHFPNGNKKQFNFLGEMRNWFWDNITDGIQVRLQENEFKHLKCIKNDRKEAYAKSIGYYYTRV